MKSTNIKPRKRKWTLTPTELGDIIFKVEEEMEMVRVRTKYGVYWPEAHVVKILDAILKEKGEPR